MGMESRQRSVKDLDWVQSAPAGAVLDLMPATGSRSRDDRIGRRVAHGRKKHEFADFLRKRKRLLLKAKRTRHPATAAGNKLHVVAGGQREHLGCGAGDARADNLSRKRCSGRPRDQADGVLMVKRMSLPISSAVRGNRTGTPGVDCA